MRLARRGRHSLAEAKTEGCMPALDVHAEYPLDAIPDRRDIRTDRCREFVSSAETARDLGLRRSVMLVPAHALDIVPRSSLMAALTLAHFNRPTTPGNPRILLAGNPLRNHVEVHHVVAGRCLVTLRAIGRSRGRMPELRNGPLLRRMTARTVFSEQSRVRLLGRMAALAIQCAFERADLGVSCRRRLSDRKFVEPLEQLRSLAHVACRRVQFQSHQSHTGQRDVVHAPQIGISALMLDVALGALLDLGMKRGRLALNECSVVGVASDALRIVGTLDCRMAGGAIALKSGMGTRERPGARMLLPRGDADVNSGCSPHDDEQDCCSQDSSQHQPSLRLDRQLNHRRPK